MKSNGRKILVLEYRRQPYLDSERAILERNCGEYYEQMELVDVLADLRSLRGLGERLSEYCGVVVGGSGECEIPRLGRDRWLGAVVEESLPLLRRVHEEDKPYLGLCWGMQLMAHALGGRVLRDADQEEVGTVGVVINESGVTDGLVKVLGKRAVVMQAHKDSVASVSKGGVVLGSSERCRVQAVRWGQNVYGVQFHAEMTDKDWWGHLMLYAKNNPESGYEKKFKKLGENLERSEAGLRLVRGWLDRYCQEGGNDGVV